MRDYSEYEIEILQWGKILEKNEENIIIIPNVSKIYEPEPDRIPIEYEGLKLTEIPEWLFSKKVTSTVMSTFKGSSRLTSIPEGLFKNNVNVTSFSEVFSGCSGLTSIPEGLFKNNVNVTSFNYTFLGCSGLTSIPEGLFKNNVNVTSFDYTFSGCSGLTSIPEVIVEFAKKVKEKGGNTYSMFSNCTSASNYASIPDYMK